MDAPVIERRATAGITASGRVLSGYAAVYGVDTKIGGFTERIAPGAFKETLASGRDVLALADHDQRAVLGRTKTGTLTLHEDGHGLAFTLALQSLGARHLPSLRGDVIVPRQKTASTAQWIAEGDSLTDSGLTFDSVKLQPRHVGAISELSRQLLQQSNPAIENLVRQDFIQVVSLAVDAAMIDGDGVKEPEGLLTAATGTGTLATATWAAVLELIESLALLNVKPNAWVTSPEVATKLRSTLKAASAGSEYLMQGGQMAGLPVTVSNQIAKNGTAGRIILGDFSELLIGTWGSVEVVANPWGAAFERGGVQVRILTTLDMVPRRENAFIVVDDVTL